MKFKYIIFVIGLTAALMAMGYLVLDVLEHHKSIVLLIALIVLSVVDLFFLIKSFLRFMKLPPGLN